MLPKRNQKFNLFRSHSLPILKVFRSSILYFLKVNLMKISLPLLPSVHSLQRNDVSCINYPCTSFPTKTFKCCSKHGIVKLLLSQMLKPGEDYPWLQCNQSWNSRICHPFFANGSTLENGWFFNYYNSAIEFMSSTYDLNARNIMSMLSIWVLVLLPLWKGPISLVRSFYVVLPTALIINVFLFFCGVSLPGASDSIARLKDPTYYYNEISLVGLLFLCYLFYGENGRFFMLGRLIETKMNILPNIYIALSAVFVLQVLSVLKVAGFHGHFKGLFHAESVQAQYFYMRSYNHELLGLSVSLTQIPASSFWLLLQYLYLLCVSAPFYSFTLETVAFSLAECIPYQSFPRLKILASRTKFPENLILPGFLGLVGIVISICEMKSRAYDAKSQVYFTLYISFYLVLTFILVVILPLSFRKSFNRGRQDLLSFMSRHGRRGKVLNIVTIVISVLLSFVFFVGLCVIQAIVRGHEGGQLSDAIFICFVMLIVGIVLQVILHIRNPANHPWCSPLGPEMDHTGVMPLDDEIGDENGASSYTRMSEGQNDDEPLIQP